MKKIHISLVVAISCLLFAGSAAAQASKVGFINPQRIVSESKVGRVAQEDLARLGEEKDRRVREQLAVVQALQEKLDSGQLPLAEQQSVEKTLRVEVREYEDLVQNSNLDIQGEERRLIQFVMRQADSILQRIAQEGGFTMILTDPEIIGFVVDSMDITDRVIRELDALN